MCVSDFFYNLDVCVRCVCEFDVCVSGTAAAPAAKRPIEVSRVSDAMEPTNRKFRRLTQGVCFNDDIYRIFDR